MPPGTTVFTAHVLAQTTCAEDCSLKGKPAKTPIIAGTICGTVMLVAWVIGFTIYCRKRRRRNRLLAEERNLDEADIPPEGILSPTPDKSTIKSKPEPEYYKPSGASKKHHQDDEEPEERVIIPPDPAVLTGQWKPGEYVIPEKEKKARPGMVTRFSSKFGRKSESDTKVKQAGGGGVTDKAAHRNGSMKKEKGTESTSELLVSASHSAPSASTATPPQSEANGASAPSHTASTLASTSQTIPNAEYHEETHRDMPMPGG
jgi:hypothetical protein